MIAITSVLQAKGFTGSCMSEIDILGKRLHQLYIAVIPHSYSHSPQEHMIQEMERVIAKREQIAVKFKVKSEASAERSTKKKGGVLDGGNLTSVSGRGGRGGECSDLTMAALKKRVGHLCDLSFWLPKTILDARLLKGNPLL